MSEQTTPDGAESPIIVERQGRVGHIRLNRPKALNALNEATMRAVVAAVQELDTDPEIGAILLSGSPKAFAAGADIKEMRDMTHAQMVTEARSLQSAFSAVAAIPQPTVAALTGAALGGGMELALCCDRRIAASKAKLGQPEILLGIIPGAGGTQRLTRLVGPAVAKDLCLTGRTLSAAEALELRAVEEVVEDGRTTERALEWARQFVGGPRIALRAVKEAVDRGIEVDLDTGLAIERALFAALFATEDRELGMQSFIDNGPGKAQFTGR